MEFSLASNSQQSSCLSFSVVITGISFLSLRSGKLLFSQRSLLVNIGKLLTLLTWCLLHSFPVLWRFPTPQYFVQEVLRFFFDGLVKPGWAYKALCGWGRVRQGGTIEYPLGKAQKSS